MIEESLERDYIEQTHKYFKSQWFYLAWVAIFLYFTFGLLDYVTAKEHIVILLSIRFSVVLLFLLGLVPVYVNRLERYIIPTSVIVISWAGLGLAWMSTYTGGFSSSYFGGILLVFYGFSLFLPMPLWGISSISVSIFFGYIFINTIKFGFDSLSFGPCFFLSGGVCLAIYSNIINENNRKREFITGRKLLDVSRSKERFFANISHELRTPLTLILGPIEALSKQKEKKIDEETFDAMNLNAKRLLRQINQILDISKIDNSEEKMIFKNSNLNELIEDLVRSCYSQISKKSLSFSCEGLNLPIFSFDYTKIETVFANLLSNALKFTDENGKITVRAQKKDGNIIVEVKNTGQGIPKDKIGKIFERFGQLDKQDTRASFGTGIGLYVTRNYVEAHSGKIEVDSVENEETTFRVILPYKESHAEAQNSERTDTLKRSVLLADVQVSEANINKDTKDELKRLNQVELEKSDELPLIVSVEDNESLRNYIKKELSDDYRVCVAENGSSGLELIRECRPDLIISDQMMPIMTGTELCQEIKADNDLSTTPFLLLTAKGAREDIVGGFEDGVDDYLVKPFNTFELKAKIKAQLRIKNLYEKMNSLELENNAYEIQRYLRHHVNNSLVVAKHASRVIKNDYAGEKSKESKNIETVVEKLERSINNIEKAVMEVDKDSKINFK